MKRFDTTVHSLRRLSQDYAELRFAWPEDLEVPLPGSFITVRPGPGSDPLLRRPFAFSDFSQARNEAAFIFQIRGPATRRFATLANGALIDVLGPLGKGFRDPAHGSLTVLVGGGIGLGPMLFAAGDLLSKSRKGLGEAPVLALGFRSASFIPKMDFPEGTVLCTDDGSAGFNGSVLDWLSTFDAPAPLEILACGPPAMMASLDRLVAGRNLVFQAATEQWMACGVGACMGCAVRMKDGSFLRACSDGPVFDGRAVDWE